jgi:hypothetical protein
LFQLSPDICGGGSARESIVDPNKIIGSSKKLKFGSAGSNAAVSSGMVYPVADLITTFKPEVWEDFTEEWAYSQDKKYAEIIRYAGAGDMGLDILCFHTKESFKGPWDNVQCKRYACELMPSQVWVELGKIIYYSFIGEYPPPQNYYFAASKGLGLKLKKLLTQPGSSGVSSLRTGTGIARRRSPTPKKFRSSARSRTTWTSSTSRSSG